MDLKPLADTQYPPQDRVMVVCHIDAFGILVYKDWNGTTQERLVGRGVWPIKTTELNGLKNYHGDDPTIEALNVVGSTFEVTVGRSAAMDRR